MSVVRLQSVPLERFLGLSSDDKPTTGVSAGATFHETDTGETYTFDGSAWTQVAQPDSLDRESSTTNQLLACVLSELREIRHIVQLATGAAGQTGAN